VNLDLLTQLCSIPTAPFVEERVYDYIHTFATQRRGLRIAGDRFGNRLIQLAGRSRDQRLIFVAHTDHPGFIAQRMLDKRTLHAEFRGAVLKEIIVGSKVRFFDGDREIGGVIISAAPDKDRPIFAGAAKVRVDELVRRGAFGMFDVPVARVKGGKFFARVCDDLAGAAAALTMIDQLHRSKSKPKRTIGVLLTRAEEVGFIGAIAAAKDEKLIRKSDALISIECSPEQPFAPQGKGVIIRVGDRTSIFNSGLMYWLTAQANLLAKKDKSFKFQRALMPGGSCEGTAFDAYGYTAGAVCVPLGNYHNMDRAKKKIAPEYVDLNDWWSMVKLFVQWAKNYDGADGLADLRKRLDERFAQFKRLL
jgi:endoglucanase